MPVEHLNRLSAIFFVYTSNLNLGSIPDLEKTVVPKLSEHEDKIYQNEKAVRSNRIGLRE